MRRSFLSAAVSFALAAGAFLLLQSPRASFAATVNVTGGQTSIAFDAAALTTAGLTISGNTGGVVTPGELPNSLGFPINARDAAARPTTFAYDPANFPTSATGTIEHTGTVQFNTNPALDVGDFSIGFDATRTGTLNGAASGFFIQSNAALPGIVFDLGQPTNQTATDTNLTIDANVLASPEFAAALMTNQVTTTDVSGSVLGTGRINATVMGEQPPPQPPPSGIPLPPALIPGLACLGMLGLGAKVRKIRTA
jgi:hypothetical protein